MDFIVLSLLVIIIASNFTFIFPIVIFKKSYVDSSVSLVTFKIFSCGTKLSDLFYWLFGLSSAFH